MSFHNKCWKKDISNLISQYKADIATGKRDQSHLLSTKNSHLTHPAAGLEALDVDAEVVVGVVGQGGVGVEDGGHGGRIQVARVGVHLQLQLGALWLPVMGMLMMILMMVRIMAMVDNVVTIGTMRAILIALRILSVVYHNFWK